jgi:hypothetical protein
MNFGKKNGLDQQYECNWATSCSFSKIKMDGFVKLDQILTNSMLWKVILHKLYNKSNLKLKLEQNWNADH